MNLSQEVLLIAATLLLGLRHGVDWDHIAAISDITSTQGHPRTALWLGTVYAIGHATVVGFLGILAVLLDFRLPSWVDTFMEPFVGITLVLLGAYVIYSLWEHGSQFQWRSRWMLLWESLEAGYHRLRGRPQPRSPRSYGTFSAYVIGMIHGIGAETPTQVLLFIAAAGAAGHREGITLVLTFILGLLLSNTLIVLASTLGFQQARQHSTAYLLLGGVAGVFSITVGTMFLFGLGGMLPAIFGQ